MNFFIYWYKFIFRKADHQYGDFITISAVDMECPQIQAYYKELFSKEIDRYMALQHRVFCRSTLTWHVSKAHAGFIGTIGWKLTGSM